MSDETNGTRAVEVGDDNITVRRFSGFKALLVAELINEVMEQMPNLAEELGAYAREYRERNTIKLSRTAAEMEYGHERLEKITDEAWKDSGGFLELPARPGPMEIAGHFFPKLFAMSRDRAVKLLALVAIPNSELERADVQGEEISELINAWRNKLIHRDLDQLIDLLGAGAEVISEQFEGKGGALSALRSLFGSTSSPSEEASTSETEEEEGSTENSSKPTSSTDSPAPTDGAGETSSIESPGPSSIGSAAP